MKRILIVGYGSLGQGITPLLFRHFPELDPTQVTAIAADDLGRAVAEEYGINFNVTPLTPSNYRLILPMLVGAGDMLLNLSVDVSSIALIRWCQQNDVNYLDTCIEPWAGGYADVESIYHSTNHYLREQAIAMKAPGKATAVIAHGANPGLVSYFVKAGLKDLAERRGLTVSNDYAAMAEELDVRVIQIAERDTQSATGPYRTNDFVNTWSVDGLISEAVQFAEMSMGTHEHLGKNQFEMSGAAGKSIMLMEESYSSFVKSWVPSVGPQFAYHITHHEAFSIADMLTVRKSNGRTHYRPTVYYAYHPSQQTCSMLEMMHKTAMTAHSISMTNIVKRVAGAEIAAGADELGVLFVCKDTTFWYGSTLTIEQARALVPHNNATTLQVTATIIGAMKWIEQNPMAGVVEAEDIDYNTVMDVALPYLGHVGGVESDWRPSPGKNTLEYQEFVQILSGLSGTEL
jgi:homospermidine synthase